jgi:hypothetical protein
MSMFVYFEEGLSLMSGLISHLKTGLIRRTVVDEWPYKSSENWLDKKDCH